MDIRRYIYNKLKEINVSESELSAETSFILEKYLKINNIYDCPSIEHHNLREMEFIFEKRKNGYPLQYILNVADFMGEEFFVNENVLIPRPETEILVNTALEITKKFTHNNIRVLDIGSGSGCIPIILFLKNPTLQISSCDISQKALEVAKRNAQKMKANVNFIHSDLYTNVQGKFDIIVSNPPYIPPSKKKSIQREVSYEPCGALYTVDELGIEFYEKIIKGSFSYLQDGGYLLFELGINQAKLVKEIFLEYNYTEIEITKDLDNIDRVISARKK